MSQFTALRTKKRLASMSSSSREAPEPRNMESSLGFEQSDSPGLTTFVSKYCLTARPSELVQNRHISSDAALANTEVASPWILAAVIPSSPQSLNSGIEGTGPILVVGSTSKHSLLPSKSMTRICMISTQH
eukprot:s1290_g14.t1